VADGQTDDRGAGEVLADNNGGGTYNPGLARRQGTTDLFQHPDWIGSARALSNSAGAFPNALRYL
jgi:hypothetical protein